MAEKSTTVKNLLDEEESTLEFFIRPNATVKYSCAARLNGEIYVFGGAWGDEIFTPTYEKQISKIIDCGLKRVADLPFESEIHELVKKLFNLFDFGSPCSCPD